MKNLCMLLLFMLVGCEKSGTNEFTIFQAMPSIEGGVNFATLHATILKPMCVGCHAWADSEATLGGRVVPGNSAASSLYTRVLSGNMPQGGPTLTSAQLAIVEAYIMATNTPRPPPIELKPTYSSLQVHLFEQSCTMCHGENRRGSSKRIPPLVTHEDITEHIEDIQEQLDFGTMPPLDDNGDPQAPVPTQAVLEAFRDWVQNGMPND